MGCQLSVDSSTPESRRMTQRRQTVVDSVIAEGVLEATQVRCLAARFDQIAKLNDDDGYVDKREFFQILKQPMWMKGPSLPHTSPLPVERHTPAAFISRAQLLRNRRMLIPERIVFTSLMPPPAAYGA